MIVGGFVVRLLTRACPCARVGRAWRRRVPQCLARKASLAILACILCSAPALRAQNGQIFKGEICLDPGGNPEMFSKLQPAAPCPITSAKKRAHYVLANPGSPTIYQLDGSKRFKAYAGNNVFVVGSLDKSTRTIYVNDIFPVLPPVVTRAKAVYIDCDACPRGMAAAWLAAFEALTDWARFDVVAEPRKADLVFVVSANPYLGDYVTRDGPDKRPVKVDITYMDVVDPRTGESLWSGSRQWGALFVSKATKDLIFEFKEELQVQEKLGTG